MLYLSPSHAWADWLDRPGDLVLAASNAAAVHAALRAVDAGDLSTARKLWASVDGDQMLAAWDAQVKAMRDKSRWPSSLTEPPVKRGEKTTKKLTASISRAVFERDGYRCTYCGIPVVTQRKDGHIPRLVSACPSSTGTVSARNGSLHGSGRGGALTNRDVAKWLWITAVADHVHPAALGGPTAMDNLVTSCSGCNYGKADWTLAQLQVLEPTVPKTR